LRPTASIPRSTRRPKTSPKTTTHFRISSAPRARRRTLRRSRRCCRAALRGNGARLAPDEIERLLAISAVDMSAPGFDFDTGYGLIDARAAVEALEDRLRAEAR